MSEWKVGQRVYSVSEPEMGLGEIEKLLEGRVVQIRFDLVQQKRRYAAKGAHLQRVEMKAGDQATLRDGTKVTLSSVDKSGDHYYFTAEGHEGFFENQLHPKQVFSNVKENFLAGRWNDPKLYPLIRDTHRLKPQGDRLKAALLASNRISLLDHQLFVAWKACENLPVRMLLSDEVGLGKTIESGLIMTLLLGLGRAQRVAITCPDALQNQWLAEVYRRFNIYISVFPEVEGAQESADFLASHRHVLVPWSRMPLFLAGFQTASSPFDLLILDEAHQLLSEEFLETEQTGIRALECILSTRNCLFLTATPKFLGNATEFRLLNLLNDEEFPEFEDYTARVEKLKVVDGALKELAGATLPAKHPKLDSLLKGYDQSDAIKKIPLERLRTLIAEVWGYGNTVVRNRRAKLHFDIRRKLVKVPLESAHAELKNDLSAYQGMAAYPAKLAWLMELLRKRSDEKFLIIASDMKTAIHIHRELDQKGGFRAALFHEDMDLVQRDRAAEWFHQNENGAQVLVCSEIGGEGRNFQHADGLVLLDMPLEPNLLEQRIGRLDRIGRDGDVEVLVPFEANSPQSYLLEWYDEALEIFSEPWNGELDMLELTADAWTKLLKKIYAHDKTAKKDLQSIIADSREKVAAHRKSSGEALETLLDLQSFVPERAEEIRKLCAQAMPEDFIDYLERAFDSFDIDFTYLDDDDTFSVNASSLSFAEDLSEFAKFEDRTLTLDRDKALARENLTYLSIEHPIVRSICQNILQKGEGYASLAVSDVIPKSLVLQVFYTLQVPPHRGWDLTAYFASDGKTNALCGEILLDEHGEEIRMPGFDEKRAAKPKLELNAAFLQSLANRCAIALKRSDALIVQRAEAARTAAVKLAHQKFEQEIEVLQLKAFASGEADFREEMVRKRMTEIENAIRQTEPRFEALRLLINPRAR